MVMMGLIRYTKKAALIPLILLATAQSGAAKDRLDVDFGFFPEGLECAVHGTSGKVNMRQTKKELKFSIRGDTRSVSFTCKMKDGKKFKVDTAGYVRSETNFTSLQLNADNTGAVMWDDGGIRSKKISGFLKAK